MAYREVSTGNAIDIKVTPGKEYEGIYRGSRTFETQYGDQHVYNFDTFSCYGFTSLNMAMEAVPLGSRVKIVYIGKEKRKTKRGTVDMHICQVFVDDDFDPGPPDDSGAPF